MLKVTTTKAERYCSSTFSIILSIVYNPDRLEIPLQSCLFPAACRPFKLAGGRQSYKAVALVGPISSLQRNLLYVFTSGE